jgi:hypothetical protein
MTKTLLLVKALVILMRLHKRGKLPAAIAALQKHYPDVSQCCYAFVTALGICNHTPT